MAKSYKISVSYFVEYQEEDTKKESLISSPFTNGHNQLQEMSLIFLRLL
ncbi:hypothetical protein SRABI96_02447 [Peribacillus sp. Bi96]|nr:hypothetical protein SRABI96_02447 [Peribacillus sp. Bi96]